MSTGAIALIAALPRELAHLSRALEASTVRGSDGVLLQTAARSGTAVHLVTAGMGARRAALAVEAALAHGPVNLLLSVGLAGACDPAFQPGALLEATYIVDTRSGERFTPTAHPHLAAGGVLVTSPQIAGPSEKQRLHAAYNAAAVDMEAATVARLALAHGIPFAAIKAISDDHAADLTPLSAFSNAQGHFRTRAFALHTSLRPHRWRAAAHLGRHSRVALTALTHAILAHLDDPQAQSRS